MEKEWFDTWFDSKYYHILYGERDYEEANQFIVRLLSHLKCPENSSFLDIACGKGRHAKNIANAGHRVVGFDLSPESIEYAIKNADKNEEYFVHDMRTTFRTNYFDYVFNLFTSFGYFDSDRDDLNAIQSFSKALKPGGTLVMDFMNAIKVQQTLVQSEEKEVGGIQFFIERKIENGKVIKQINFKTEGRNYQFEEKVKLINLEMFTRLFEQAGLTITETFGDYQLNPFTDHSDRLIIVAKK